MSTIDRQPESAGLMASWTQDGGVYEAAVYVAAEAMNLYDRLQLELRKAPSMVEFGVAETGRAFAIAAGSSTTVLTYQSSFDPPYYTSVDDAAAQGKVYFMYGGEKTAFAAAHAIPASTGRLALEQFLEGGTLPRVVEWERV